MYNTCGGKPRAALPRLGRRGRRRAAALLSQAGGCAKRWRAQAQAGAAQQTGHAPTRSRAAARRGASISPTLPQPPGPLAPPPPPAPQLPPSQLAVGRLAHMLAGELGVYGHKPQVLNDMLAGEGAHFI